MPRTKTKNVVPRFKFPSNPFYVKFYFSFVDNDKHVPLPDFTDVTRTENKTFDIYVSAESFKVKWCA